MSQKIPKPIASPPWLGPTRVSLDTAKRKKLKPPAKSNNTNCDNQDYESAHLS